MSPLRKALELGPTAQPVVAGLYAWAVTIAPVGYGKHGGEQNWAATVFATLAFVALVRGAVVELTVKGDDKRHHKLERSRTVTLLSFSAASLVTWMCNEDALGPLKLGAARGVAGMIGWALFAYACAAPVVEHPNVGSPEPARIEAGPRARGQVQRGDALFVLATAILVVVLQVFGWSIDAPERAMLVRLTTVGAGVLLLGGAGAFVATRHAARPSAVLEGAPPKAQIRVSRPAMPLGWVIALLLLIAAGVLYVLTGNA